MLSVYVVCWIFLQTFQTYFCIQANSMDPDQTAVWSGSTLFAKMTFKITSRWQSRRQYRIRPNYRTYPYKHTVKKFRSLQITASVLFSLLLYKGICCGYKSMQFKWLLTTYAFVKKVRKNRIVIIKQGLFNSVSLAGRYVFYHSRVFPVILKNLSAQCGN